MVADERVPGQRCQHLRSSQSRDIAHLGPNLACVLPEGAQSLPMMPPGASEPLSTWLGDSRGRLVNIYISMETRKKTIWGKVCYIGFGID